ncbi:hypothetical protein N7508_008341 [Penicillium antarcticum]|uniref:uncharacterized protein n=1 Tax=Penicillium antarcticum TaxID=416450 RepID=UPI0023A422FF|nr:uncharacterized protein N7508_008341 [Penicillium antarcticum]KAJ5298092.1 hypothetical protein N7508_008341 [Penicillium antarcticum]
MKAFWSEIVSCVAPRLAYIGFVIAQPYLIRRAVTIFARSDEKTAHDRGVLLVAAFALVYGGMGISLAVSKHKAARLITLIRGGLVGMIYDKAMRLPTSSGQDEVVTAISTDIERMALGLYTYYECWAAPIELGLFFWFIYRELYESSIAAMLLSVVAIVGVVLLAPYAVRSQTAWINAIQRRIVITVELVSGAKGVKMSGIVGRLLTVLTSLRLDEISASKRYRSIVTGIFTFASTHSIVTPTVSFAIYMFVSRSKHGAIGTLDSPRAFTCLAILELMGESLLSLLQAISNISSAVGCIANIQELLNKPEREDSRVQEDHKMAIPSQHLPSCLLAKDFSAGWQNPIVKNLTFDIPFNSLTMLVGPVGCGKSTVLQAILGETSYNEGTIVIHSPDIAYCSQTPWLVNGTIRDNILGANSYCEDWYKMVIKACALQVDIAGFINKDDTIVVILDDVLSGSDAITEEHMFEQLLSPRGLLRKFGTTVILVTSLTHRLQNADLVISLGADGSLASLNRNRSLLDRDTVIKGHSVDSFKALEDKARSQITIASLTNDSNYSLHVPGETFTSEDSGDPCWTGELATYNYYLTAAPRLGWLLFVAALSVGITSKIFMSTWVKWWAHDNDIEPNRNISMRVAVDCVLSAVYAMMFLVSQWIMIHGVTAKTMMTLHQRLLKAVIRAPMSFFAENDSGATINRFKNDLELIDFELPLVVFLTIANFLQCIGGIIVVIINAHYMAAVIPVAVITIWAVETFYLRTSRQLRVLDIEAKAPILKHTIETIDGLATVRAFCWQDQHRKAANASLELSQRPFYLLMVAQIWLGLALDFVMTGVAMVLMGIGVAKLGHVSAGDMGLALTSTINIGIWMKTLIKFWMNLETSLGAVTRLKEFDQRLKPEDLPCERYIMPVGWPLQGNIQFKHVTASYGGKSTLVSALFHMIELLDGQIIIDGIDICTISRQSLRTSLNGLPQDAFLLNGWTVRDNIDFFGTSSDKEMVDALVAVNLWPSIEHKYGLDTLVTDSTFSHGQRQLLCFARALTRQGNILVVDEATSSVDADTEKLMQTLIRSHFFNHTILAVTHRPSTVLDFDRVLVLEGGHIVENGHPQELLTRDSWFAGLYRSSET